MSWGALSALKRPFRLIRRFCIQQGCGKLRVIDDATDGGQSALSSDCSKLDLCSAIQPGISAQLLWQATLAQAGPFAFTDDQLETGGEDLPHAYRLIPVKPDESWGAVVAYYDYDPHAQAPHFRRYYGLLFGLPNAVTSLNRWPRFFRAAARCLGGLVVSMYFDDLTVQDETPTHVFVFRFSWSPA